MALTTPYNMTEPASLKVFDPIFNKPSLLKSIRQLAMEWEKPVIGIIKPHFKRENNLSPNPIVVNKDVMAMIINNINEIDNSWL